jgi:hypothetical protein
MNASFVKGFFHRTSGRILYRIKGDTGIGVKSLKITFVGQRVSPAAIQFGSYMRKMK